MAALRGLSSSYNTGSLAGKGNTASGMHFKLQMMPLSQHMASIGTTIEFSDSTFAAVDESSAGSVTRKPISQRWISWGDGCLEKSRHNQRNFHSSIHCSCTTANNCVQPSPDQCRTKTCPEIPSAEDWLENRWRWMDTHHDYRTTCTTSLVKCSCKSQYHSERCSCRRAGLNCTELCDCINEKQPRENVAFSDPTALACQTYKWNYAWMHSHRKILATPYV